MPRKKVSTARTKSANKVATRAKVVKTSPGVADYFRFGESYTSLILGMVVIIILAILLVAFFRNRNLLSGSNRTTDTSSTSTSREAENRMSDTYVVTEGDTLWTIAEKNYRSGYNWIDIAKANNLENADQINEGTKLTLPKVEAKTITYVDQSNQDAQSESKITGTTYRVAEGDTLWSIAERKYNDGYRWIELAKTNNIGNPDLIYQDTTLQLPQ